MYYDNKRLALNILWMVLGVALFALSVTEVLDSSVYSGFGGMLMAIGGINIIRIVRYRRDDTYREKVDTQVADERNEFLRMKTWSVVGPTLVIVGALGSVITMVLGMRNLQLELSFSVCIVLMAYWITYLVINRKY